MRRITMVAAASLLTGAGLLASVAVSQEGHKGQPGMHSEQGMHGMMGGGMMQGCPMMNRTAAPSGASLIPQLPPGNEKLQAQMTAEIMQRVGEIASKYAAQAK
jgi:hypothetical protein